MTTNPAPGPNSRSRIPATLQAVFLASNRGKEVHKAPPNQVGSSVFFNNWFMQRKANSNGKIRSKDTRSGTGRASCDKEQIRVPLNDVKHMSPQVYLDAMLRSRGYSTQRFKTLQTSYYNDPTPLQVASYSVYMIGLVRSRDAETLERILASGISPNPCNSYGESLVHNVCRRGDERLLEILVKNGCALNVCDDYGRTPLHDACWCPEPAFETVKMILDKDVRLFHMIDSRDRLPLGYVREEDWPYWVDFLEANKDVYWPPRSKEQGEEPPPRLTQEGVNTRPLPDPANALSIEMTQLVASGRMTPEEVMLISKSGMGGGDEEATQDTGDEGDSYSDYDDSDYDSEYDSDDDDYSVEFDEDMDNLLTEMSHLRAQKAGSVGF